MDSNMFVLGIDEFNLQQLRAIRNADNYRFHSLLSFDEVKAHGTYPFQSILDHARDRLERFAGRIDAIVGYWDFPVTSVSPRSSWQIERDNPGTFIDIVVKPGMRLSNLMEQDSYSYDIAHTFTAAHDQPELLEKYARIVEAMPLQLERTGKAT